MTPPGQLPVITTPTHGRKLTPKQWARIEDLLDDWKHEVLQAAKQHPARSYQLGVRQAEAFMDLLSGVTEQAAPLMFGGTSQSMREAVKWSQTYTLRELEDALNVYVGKLKDALLYGLRHALNPTDVASLMYKATGDAEINWRMIARTEMVRANAMGRLAAIERMGYDQVWCPPHVGACKKCKRILENRVFPLAEVRDATNFGRDPREWVACIPLHPQCRHGWLPYDPDVHAHAMEHYQRMEAAGLTDEDRLADMFDESGHLRPEYSDVDLSAAKLLDPYAEGLAVAVEKTCRERRGERLLPAPERRVLRLDDLRSDLYQRALDPDKVLAIALDLQRGRKTVADLGDVEVSEREDGTQWVTDGQHRVEALKLAGHEYAECVVQQGLRWDEESQRCREAIGKAWNAFSDQLPDTDEVRKALEPVTLAEAVAPAPEPSVGGQLDPLVWDGHRPRGDVALAITTWWEHVAGQDWEAFSRLLLPWHDQYVRVHVDYDLLRDHRAEWRELADGDLHFALLAAARNAGHGVKELAPGVLMDVRIDPDPVVRESTTGMFDLGEQSWIGDPPVSAQPIDATKVFPDLVWEPIPEPTGWRGLLGRVAKAAKAKQAANTGVEHWITVHPHGPGTEGQPVLVRNNSDGTMSVIGGAGGNLNHLRLDPSRNVARGKDLKAAPKDAIEQPVSEAEAERAQAEREQQVSKAREDLAAAKERQAAAEQQLHDYAREQLGVDLHADDVTPAQRRKLLKKLRTSALRTLAYGEVQRRDLADSAGPDDLGEKPAAPSKADPELGDVDAPDDGQPDSKPPRPSMALTSEQASAVLDLFGDVAQIRKVAGKHRKVIAGEKSPSDANQIDWSFGGQAARDERRAKAVEQTIRTDLARQLHEHADRQWKGTRADRQYRSAFLQGGFDSVDAFSHSILGQSVLSREAHDLLGVAGAAQLVAHHIQSEARTRGKKDLDLKKVQAALKDLTDDREAAVSERGMNRVQAATSRAAEAVSELTKSEKGEGLFTTTMARSLMSTKVQEAKRGLGMMVGGLEACSALKVALERPAGEKIKVGGFSTPAQVKEAAAKAGVQLRASEIVRVGAGNYTLNISPERLQGLVRPEKGDDKGLRDRLRQIRTGEGLDAEIEANRTGPGMSDTLDRNQAKGKMFLRTAGSGLLGFDPGVGKTHVAIATAMEKMAAAPGKHKALIVAPTNMLRSWQNTIAAQGRGHTVSVVGQSRTNPEKDGGDRKQKLEQLTSGADFTIVSYETYKGMRSDLRQRAASGEHVPHSIVIADELQKAKNDDTANFAGIEAAVDMAVAHHGPSQPDGGGGASFYGLTGTPIEKDVSDLNSMRRLVRKAKGEATMDAKAARRKYGRLGQDEHVARGDKVRAFRKSLDTDLFRLSAEDAGNALQTPDRHEHSTPLDDEHRASYQARVKALNEQIALYHATKETGSPAAPMPKFGGYDALMDELYNREGSSIVKGVADNIEQSGTFKFAGMPGSGAEYSKGDHAGEYEHKHVVFGAINTSKALFGEGWNKGAKKPGGLHGELEKRGIKVFVGHGSMSSAQNEKNYKDFLAHKGKAVFLTNDKNNAGISLQFGDNKGAFQHGATQMHHFTRPVNNATIQQREARILRKGAATKVAYHTYNAGTPLEARLQETLEAEARTQDLAANAEQRVAGADTLAHHLKDRGVKVDG